VPKRTNPFQQLVDLICHALAPQCAKITSSAEITSSTTKTLREIDVLLETDLGLSNVKIAVEAKDHKRKLNVNDIEAIIGKYSSGNLPINQVIIVAHNGFAKTTLKRVENCSPPVKLMILKEALHENWSQIIPGMIRLSISPRILEIKLISEIELPDQNNILTDGQFTSVCCGKLHGSLHDVAHKSIFKNPELLKLIQEQAKNKIEQGGVCANIKIGISDKWILKYHDHEYHITAINVHVHAHEGHAPLSCKTYTLDGKPIQYAHAEVAGHRLEIAIPDGIKSKNIAVRIQSLPGASKT